MSVALYSQHNLVALGHCHRLVFPAMMKSLHVPAETDVDTEEDDWITAEIQRELSELNSDDLDSASDLEDEPKEEEDDLWLVRTE